MYEVGVDTSIKNWTPTRSQFILGDACKNVGDMRIITRCGERWGLMRNMERRCSDATRTQESGQGNHDCSVGEVHATNTRSIRYTRRYWQSRGGRGERQHNGQGLTELEELG